MPYTEYTHETALDVALDRITRMANLLSGDSHTSSTMLRQLDYVRACVDAYRNDAGTPCPTCFDWEDETCAECLAAAAEYFHDLDKSFNCRAPGVGLEETR